MNFDDFLQTAFAFFKQQCYIDVTKSKKGES